MTCARALCTRRRSVTGLPGGLRPRPVRPGAQLDPDRQGARRPSTGCSSSTCPTTVARPGRTSFDYLRVADQVAGLLDADDPVALVGHSLGGKVAMVLALRHPELVERLCVVDVSPVAYDHLSEFEGYIAAMRGLDLGSLSRRDDADAALAEAVPDADRARLPAPEPPPGRRRLALAGQPRRARRGASR